MPKSYRFRTEIGTDREVRLNIEQDFDQLEILSLKLRQEDLYSRFCADYGVVAGRVIANGGFGIPNVSVSIFIPLDDIDEEDPVISTLYPYKRPTDKNVDGYRYNLLPYEQENPGHTPTGTFPSRNDVLTRKEVLEIYDKYYKFTVRTNQSGDFMIVGVPLGEQKLVMDLDLSNIGKFSLRPDDLVRMGLGVPEQFNGKKFKASENLDSLPQIINQVYDVNVSSFWGEEELCDVGITRVDMDLRDLGINIEPRSIFMGSLFSTSESDFIKGNCKPKNDVGKLCDVITGPGRILAIRHGFDNDENGLPVLEQFRLDDDGYVIDNDGVWMTELPMNLRYLTTNEFGEEVESNDPSIGIPTEAKYRFKVKWFAEDGLFNEIQRANYLIPNIKEHGWTGSDTNNRPDEDDWNKSYSFSLDWNDYYDVPAAVRCEDTFYHFYYNKVYTVASHIDRFKWGWGRQKHYGIKEINDRKCHGDVNTFPVNDAQRNGKIIIMLFNFIITLLTPVFITLIIIFHVLAVLWSIMKIVVNIIVAIVNFIFGILCIIAVTVTLGLAGLKYRDCFKPLIRPLRGNPFKNISLPMLTYPDCELCECNMDSIDPTDNDQVQDMLDSLSQFPPNGALMPTTLSGIYNGFTVICGDSDTMENMGTDRTEKLLKQSQLLASGYDQRIDKAYYDFYRGPNIAKDEGDWYKSPVYPTFQDDDKAKLDRWRLNSNPTWSQALNLMNRRGTYFFNSNLIQPTSAGDPLFKASTAIKIDYVNDQLGPSNSDPVYDKAFIIITDNPLEQGQLITFNDPEKVNDWNLGLTGTTTYNENNYQTVQVKGMDPLGNSYTSNVQIYNTVSEMEYKHTAGVEYFQVIQSRRFDEINPHVNWGGNSVIEDVIRGWRVRWGCSQNQSQMAEYNKQIHELIPNFDQNVCVTIMVRGVDPRGTRQKIKYDLSRLYGYGVDNSFGNNGLENEFGGQKTVTGEFFMNVPIQPNSGSGDSYWRQNNMTPSPHYRYMGSDSGTDFGFTNANNDNLTSPSGGNHPSMETPNLWNKGFMFSIPNTVNWGNGVYTQSPTKYVSLDRSLEYEHYLDSAYLHNDAEDDRYTLHSNNFAAYGDNCIQYFIGDGNANEGYSSDLTPAWDPQRRIEGCGYQYSKPGNNNLRIDDPKDVITVSSLYLNAEASLSDYMDEGGLQARTYLTNRNNLVFRSDRLPAGDYWDDASEDEISNNDSILFRRYALHLNLNQTMYAISDDGGSTSLGSGSEFFGAFDSSGEALDAEDDNEDYGENYDLTSSMISSFGCESMVPLDCYEGSGEEFEVLDPEVCEVNDFLNFYAETRLVNGCYRFVTAKLLLSIVEDLRHFFEYRSRLRFMFAVCNGIVGESFQNNWINGTLFMPSFQKKTFYYSNPNNDNFNQVERYKYCGDEQQRNEKLRYQGPLFFNTDSNSFFYRSTPYNDSSGEFVGQEPRRNYNGQNDKNIWFPTTIAELGPKDEFIYEVSFDPQFEAYIMDRLRSTTYGENSNLLNLFIISRLRNSNFWENLLNLGDASIGQLFSREGDNAASRFYDARIDGDYAQLSSIASELGVIPFLEGEYTNQEIYIDSNNIGVWFQSDTILRRKITNGTMTYGLDPEGPNYIYGFDKTQEVPYYMWNIKYDNPENSLFGTELNSWNTNKVYSSKYQGDDFFSNTPLSYMKPDFGYGQGYIFNRSVNDSTFNQFPGNNPNNRDFKVGGPFHFYFGLKRGRTAITRFIKKYIELQ